MNKRISITLAVLLLVSTVLTACGGPAPVTFNSLPVFTGATESTNDLLVAALPTAIDAAKAISQSAEGKAYDVPEGTTFDAIVAFYKPALEKGGWTVKSSSDPELVLTRGSQGLNIAYIGGINGLIVVLSQGNK
jgi:hypothetical protein